MKSNDLTLALEAERTGTAQPMLDTDSRRTNRAVEGAYPEEVPDDLADEEDELTSMEAAVRATLKARHDTPLGDDELAGILDRVHSVRFMPRSDRQIRRFVAGHLTVPNPDGRMLILTRASDAMPRNSVGALLEAFPELKPAAPITIPVVDIRVAVDFEERAVGRAMLSALGISEHPNCDYETWKQVRRCLGRKRTQVIHWDLQGPKNLARGRWFKILESIVLNCLIPYGSGRLFVCTGPWPAERIFPGVRIVREAGAVVDDTCPYDASDVLVDAMEEMAALAGLSLEAGVRETVISEVLSSRSPKARLRWVANAIARALAPMDGNGARLAPCQALSAKHFQRMASAIAVGPAMLTYS